MAGQPERVEVLVHAAAAADGSADYAVYHGLARAFLAFQPATRVRLLEPPGAEPELVLGLNSQDLSFQGACGNGSSPRLPRAGRDAPSAAPAASPAASPPFCPPPSQIGDSYPLPDAAVMRATPTRLMERFLGEARTWPHASDSPPTSPSPGCGRGEDQCAVEDGPSALPLPRPGSLRSSLAPAAGVVPVTPFARQDRTGPAPDEEARVLDTTHVPSSMPSPWPLPRAGSEPLRPGKPRAGGGGSVGLGRSVGDAGPLRSSGLGLAAGVLEIRPPSPPVGVACMEPSDLVPARLAELARQLGSRYRATEARPLAPFERGYWLLDCSRWRRDARDKAWSFLANYLGEGFAGWGVWCRRGAAHDWIRLYCWGHVAKHTFLLLYLASDRRVKATGARWFGADGEPVVEVAPR